MGELLARIDSRELNAWEAYERVAGPLDPGERGDIQAAVIASAVANAARTSKQSRQFKPEDFIPKWDDPARWAPAEQDGMDHLRAVRGLNKSMGGRTGRVRTRGDGGGDSPGPADQGRD